jgi:transcriptional regulator with XRE-family HTH domain
MTKTKSPRVYLKRYYLISRRAYLKFSQLTVAKRTGMQVCTYNQIENGKLGNLMNAYWLQKLADALNTPIAEIVRLESAHFVNYLKVNKINRDYLN